MIVLLEQGGGLGYERVCKKLGKFDTFIRFFGEQFVDEVLAIGRKFDTVAELVGVLCNPVGQGLAGTVGKGQVAGHSLV